MYILILKILHKLIWSKIFFFFFLLHILSWLGLFLASGPKKNDCIGPWFGPRIRPKFGLAGWGSWGPRSLVGAGLGPKKKTRLVNGSGLGIEKPGPNPIRCHSYQWLQPKINVQFSIKGLRYWYHDNVWLHYFSIKFIMKFQCKCFFTILISINWY